MVNHLNGGDSSKVMCKQNAALSLRESWQPIVSSARGVSEVVEINSRFTEGGDGRINHRCF